MLASALSLVDMQVTDLGGIPIISSEAASSVPDEKTNCLYVTYICARLLGMHRF